MRCGVGKKDGCYILYVKDVTEVLRKQAPFCGKNDIAFHPGRGNTCSRGEFTTTITDYIRTNYKEGKKTVMGSSSSGDV